MADADDGGTLHHEAARQRRSQTISVQEEWNDLLLSRAKLKQSSNTSALLSGFAMVAMVEIEIGDVHVDPILLIIFSVVTTTLVATHLFALMISTCILPRIATTMAHKPTLETLRKSPHRHVQFYIEMSWIFSTWIGIILFLVDVVLIAWVRFSPLNTDRKGVTGSLGLVGQPAIRQASAVQGNATVIHNSHGSVNLTITTELTDEDPYRNAAIAASVVLVFFMLCFMMFAYQFYKYMIKHRFNLAKSNIEEMRKTMDGLHAQDVTREPDTFSRLSVSGDWYLQGTPGLVSQVSQPHQLLQLQQQARFTYPAAAATALDEVGARTMTTPAGTPVHPHRERAESQGSIASYQHHPYRHSDSYGPTPVLLQQQPTVAQAFSQQSAMYLNSRTSALLAPPSPHYAGQQLTLVPMPHSPNRQARRSASAQSSSEHEQKGVHSVCIREGADINSDHSSNNGSHESHPHMFVSAEEYAKLRSARPANPTHWQSAQEEPVGHRTPVISPHAALRYTIPASMERQMSQVSDLSMPLNPDQVSNTSEASFLTATGPANITSVSGDKTSHVADWVDRQSKRYHETKDTVRVTSSSSNHHAVPPIGATESSSM